MKQENNKPQEEFVLQKIDGLGMWIFFAALFSAAYFNVEIKDIKQELLYMFYVSLPFSIAYILIEFISLFVKTNPEWFIVLKRRINIISLRLFCLVMPFILLIVILKKVI